MTSDASPESAGDTSPESAGNDIGETLKPVVSSSHPGTRGRTGTGTEAKPEIGGSPKESATRRRLRGAESSPEKENADTAKPVPLPPIDEETDAALILFNTYLEADHARRQYERDIKKAEKAKTDAAAKVRRLNNREASSAETAEAEAAYRETVDALNRLKQNKQNKQNKPVGAD